MPPNPVGGLLGVVRREGVSGHGGGFGQPQRPGTRADVRTHLGEGHAGRYADLFDEDFDAVIHTHLRGTFTCARAAARHFRNAGHGGRLILVSSIAGQRGNLGQTAYSAAKAGIAAMARTWSIELGRLGVTVNAIVPNALTAMTQTIPALKPFADAIAQGQPLPDSLRKDFGLGGPEDVAAAFVYLASERSAGITGQCIGIGGDRLSVWSHPVEADHRLRDGGWDAEALADALEGPLAGALQDVGVNLKLEP